MATSNCTLGNRFAESKFLVKSRLKQKAPHTPEHSLPGFSPCFDTHIAELMETLRIHMNSVLRLPIPVQKRSRLVRNYWEVEYLVKEMRCLLVDNGLAITDLDLDGLYGLNQQTPHQAAKSP
jgi:hypothetical protein